MKFKMYVTKSAFSSFSFSLDWPYWKLNCPLSLIQRRTTNGQCLHDSWWTLIFPNVCFLGWNKHWRYGM